MPSEHFDGVSVCVFTFNYEKYISECIESILMQKRSFPIEIVVGDDNSTDNTRAILEEYKIKYPDLFVLLFDSQKYGGTRNWVRTINACKGKYVCLIDGDDYFCDEGKLQLQYGQLEKNLEFVMSTHSVLEKYDDNPELNKVVEFEQDVYSLADIIKKGWFMRTGSLFFRNSVLPENPPLWVYDFPYRYDSIIPVMLNLHGKTLNIKRVLSVWRKHRKGMSKKLMEDKISNSLIQISLAHKLNELARSEFSRETLDFVSRNYSFLFLTILRNHKVRRDWRVFIDAVIRMNYGYTLQLLIEKFNGTKNS